MPATHVVNLDVAHLYTTDALAERDLSDERREP
jgi:hypothetical protein